MAVQMATIDTSAENAGPTLEESHAALVDDGTISTETNENVVDDINNASQGEENKTDGQTTDRPSWLPEKFKSPEDMAKAYSELEQKQSGKPEDTQSEPEVTEGQAKEVVEDAGLDFDSMSKEFEANGELSADTYATLAKANIPEDMVNAYIDGINAQTELYENSVKDVAGGDEAYDALLSWGESNLTPDEISTFDTAVNSMDVATAKAAVEGMNARMKLDQGLDPARVIDGKGGDSDGAYQSQAQIEADMNDPRYATDPAFRQKVYNKMAKSEF